MKKHGNKAAAQAADEVELLKAQLARVGMRMERLKAETGRKNSRLSTILANMQDGLLAVDEQNQVILLSPRAEELSGAGKSLFVSGSSGSRSVTTDRILEATREVIETQKPLTLSLMAGDRELAVDVTPIRSKYLPFDNDGALAILRDVTEIRRLERLRNEFVSNVSHELRTPLTAIAGFVETLQMDEDISPDDRRRALEIISLETDRLRRLISELLLLSHIENDLMRRTDERMELSEVLSKASRVIELLAEQKGQSFRCEGLSHPCVINGRGDWLLQALINLGENAVKYTPSGGSIWISATQEGQQVLIEVGDNGVGIPPQDLPRIFERFYRVDKARSGKSGGSGLGLSIVKHIVEELEGEISAHSTVGKGSSFVITLTLK
ncbi:MAG: ATP-binding protein [Angelakisella sp.]